MCPQYLWIDTPHAYGRTTLKGLASYCKAETTFTFHFSILTLSSAFLSINNREMKSESGFSFAMASQPFIILELEHSKGGRTKYQRKKYQQTKYE